MCDLLSSGHAAELRMTTVSLCTGGFSEVCDTSSQLLKV